MKATHDGHCQLCGRLQRLPDGVLALHGYTVQWGFFSGQCPGSKHLPYEQSKDLIDGCIAGQLAAIERAQANAAALRDPAKTTGETCWVNEYVTSRRGQSVYQWREVAITKTPWTSDDGTVYHSYRYTKQDGKLEKLNYVPFEIKDDLHAVVLWANEKRAAQVFDREVQERKNYVAWLRQRAADWTLAPLVERAK